MKQLKSLLCLSLFLGTSAHSSITFDIQAEDLRTSGGAIPTDGLVILVADTGNNGFGAVEANRTFSSGSFLNAANDDQILWKNSIVNTAGLNTGAFADFTSALNLDANWTTGDPLALLWFPTLTNATASSTANDSYGLFSGPALNGSNSWVTPSNGASGYKLYFFTSSATGGTLSATGSHANSLGNASLTVTGVPEPSRSLLGLIGFGVLALRRRR